ncbi:MAG: hypothetical protein R6V14_05390 [Halanaerobiales bacterium]
MYDAYNELKKKYNEVIEILDKIGYFETQSLNNDESSKNVKRGIE